MLSHLGDAAGFPAAWAGLEHFKEGERRTGDGAVREFDVKGFLENIEDVHFGVDFMGQCPWILICHFLFVLDYAKASAESS
jgi:hypothetical protein